MGASLEFRHVEPGYSPLACAQLEAGEIRRGAPGGRYLSGAAATRAEFLAHAADYEVLHLCCHGSEGSSAAGARLLLADGPLIVDDLNAIPPLDNVALAVLSACWSGHPDWFIPEESTDIGSLLLAAGARAVVANMWPVDDLAAALFVSGLFQYWDWGAGLPLPAAVSAARLWVKDITVADLHDLARAQPQWEPHVRRYTRFMPPEMKRFEKAYYWAAFGYSGG
jgi:CHAT domain-containing protein